ncbi:hypothetical protein I308_101629 [Cryptococcus tetragattii IND107]|uniref:Uncharacterized protein n=1 Tax=Cryptococcus tetragattii IND107 TaxID=1296105 RepID=A0ABR3C0U8_9TREE
MLLVVLPRTGSHSDSLAAYHTVSLPLQLPLLPHNRSLVEMHSSLKPSPTDRSTRRQFAALDTVRDIILDHLCNIAPTTTILVNKHCYKRTVPVLYGKALLSPYLLYGITCGDKEQYLRTANALQHVRALEIDDMRCMAFLREFSIPSLTDSALFPIEPQDILGGVERLEMPWTVLHFRDWDSYRYEYAFKSLLKYDYGPVATVRVIFRLTEDITYKDERKWQDEFGSSVSEIIVKASQRRLRNHGKFADDPSRWPDSITKLEIYTPESQRIVGLVRKLVTKQDDKVWEYIQRYREIKDLKDARKRISTGWVGRYKGSDHSSCYGGKESCRKLCISPFHC